MVRLRANGHWKIGRTVEHKTQYSQLRQTPKTEQFKQIARKAKEAKWKSICEKSNPETTLTQFCQFYQQMEGNDCTKTTPDI